MSTMSMELGVFELPARNRLATESIQGCATRHALVDAAIGLGGFFPFPGAATAAIVASLLAQIPVYRGLAEDLRRIYCGPIPDLGADEIVGSGMMVDSAVSLGADVAVGAGMDAATAIVNQFGVDFLYEIKGELLHEIAVGFGASWIPILGGFVSVGLDVAIAITMTWRVGTMVSIYYQNGERWVGSRRETYRRAKELTGDVSEEQGNGVDLDAVPERIPEVERYHIERWAQFLESLLGVAPDLTDNRLREILREKNVPKGLAEAVIRHVRG